GLPDVAEHFAADARLDRVAARHDAARRGEDARAQAAHDLRHVVAPEVDAPAGPAHALEAGDHVLAARAVLQRQADHRALAVRLLQLEAGDVAFLLEDLGDFRLEARRRNVHALVPRAHGVADPREHVCNRVSHLSILINFEVRSLTFEVFSLPAALDH